MYKRQVDVLETATPTLTPDPDVFARVMPITTVVVEEGAVYIPTVVTPTLAFVFNLKVFAIVCLS